MPLPKNIMTERPRSKPSKRFANPPHPIRFDDDVYATIKARAKQAGVSFCEEVRTLVEFGLESVSEEEGPL